MANEDQVVVRVKLKDLRQFVADTKEARDWIDKLSRATKESQRQARMASGSSGGFGLMTRQLGAMNYAVRYGAIALAGAGAAAVTYGVKSAASLEQTTIGFTTMLGSAEAAQKMLQDIKQFALTTPFQFPDLVTGSQRLLAFGFQSDRVLGILRTIGDSSAALGLGTEGIQRMTTAIGQIQAKGRVQGDELLQLSEAGIPALQILAEGLGKTTVQVSKMVTAGRVGAAQGIDILLGGMQARFGGLMDKQSKTAIGTFSNFKDAIGFALRDTATPFLPFMTRGIKELQGAMPGIQRALANWSKNAVSGLDLTITGFRLKDPETVFRGLDQILGGGGKWVPWLRDAFAISQNLGQIWTDIIWPAFKGAIAALTPGGGKNSPLHLLAIATGLLAHNAGVLEPLLRLLIAGFVAYKAIVILDTAVTATWGLALGVLTGVQMALGLQVTATTGAVYGQRIAFIVARGAVIAWNAVGMVSRLLYWAAETAAIYAWRGAMMLARGAALLWNAMGMLTMMAPLLMKDAAAWAILTGRTVAATAVGWFWTAYVWGATAAQWAWNAAMNANPLMLIVIGIAALIVGLVLAYKHWGWFRAIVQTIGRDGKEALREVGAAFVWLWHASQTAIDWITVSWDTMVTVFKAGLGFGLLWEPLKNGFKAAINFIIGIWNGLDFDFGFTIPDYPGVPHRGEFIGVHDIVPDIPYLAKGGTAKEGGTAVVGENHMPELINLPKGASVTPLPYDEMPSMNDAMAFEFHMYIDGREVQATVQRREEDRVARL